MKTLQLGWLDRVPRPARHFLIGLLFTALTWTTDEGLPWVGPWLNDHQPAGPLAAALLSQLVLYATPLIRSYGLAWSQRDSYEPRHDAGKATAGVIEAAALALVVVLVAAAALACLSGGSAAADGHPVAVATPPPAPSPAPAPVVIGEVPSTGSAHACADGVLIVAYRLERFTHPTDVSDEPIRAELAVNADDGAVVVQLLEAGHSSPNGAWRTVPATSGGEGLRRWPGYGDAVAHGVHYTLARVVRDGVASSPALIEDGCAA